MARECLRLNKIQFYFQIKKKNFFFFPEATPGPSASSIYNPIIIKRNCDAPDCVMEKNWVFYGGGGVCKRIKQGDRQR